MYNRYIPQSDGTYRRSRVAEPISRPPQKPQPKPQCPQPEPKKPCPPPQEPKPPCPPHKAPPSPPPPKAAHLHQPMGVDHFLKNLLPPGFDTADLIIILLLLLLAGDCQEDRTTAMLTLVLYLFL